MGKKRVHTLNVTKAHIQDGVRKSISNCALALAAKDIFNKQVIAGYLTDNFFVLVYDDDLTVTESWIFEDKEKIRMYIAFFDHLEHSINQTTFKIKRSKKHLGITVKNILKNHARRIEREKKNREIDERLESFKKSFMTTT